MQFWPVYKTSLIFNVLKEKMSNEGEKRDCVPSAVFISVGVLPVLILHDTDSLFLSLTHTGI